MIKEEKAKTQLGIFKSELSNELGRILEFWSGTAPDEVNGGFYGKIDNANQIILNAPKGSVLNARILWTFSAAFNQNPEPVYLDMAGRAYRYITNYMVDKEYGGVYWSVDDKGIPLDTKKQVYALAFTIYALSEFYKASGIESAKQEAIDLFYLLAENAYDAVQSGYFEAFTRDWKPMDDLRLSAKDANEKKTMNTHLHLLEAYTTLYRVWPDKALRSHLLTLLYIFFDHFIDHETHHLALFFDENWKQKSRLVSYGHDIEATWLLLQAAETIADKIMIEKVKKLSIRIAEATIKGLDTDGGLWYEYEPAVDHLVKEKHWWVQAEAMVGFYNAWQISGEHKYLELSFNSWDFIKNNLLDKAHGEWFWGIDQYGRVMPSEDKVGIWKCPYHNSRACMEIIRRIGQFEF